jgi:hypothetical protein
VSAPPGVTPDPQQNGTPGRIRVSKVMRHRLAAALSAATGMPFAKARAVIAQRAGDSVDELEAWLRANYRLDPVGVTAVRNVSRARS